MPYGNIMYDRRIVRGNTYAQRTLPAVSVADQMKMLFVCSVLNKGQAKMKLQHNGFCLQALGLQKQKLLIFLTFLISNLHMLLQVWSYLPPPPPSQEKGIWVDRVNTMCFQFVIHYVNFYSYKDFFKQLKKLA